MLEVLVVATRLGLTSFGGPIAHLGYFREEYVRRRKWIDEDAYADLVALCQFLPGPTSSQVGIAIGIVRAGLPGAVAAWLGFTLPSAIILVAFAFGLQRLGVTDAGWLHGLKIAAVAVVANAVWGMAHSLAPDRERATIAILSAVVVLAWPGAPGLGHERRIRSGLWGSPGGAGALVHVRSIPGGGDAPEAEWDRRCCPGAHRDFPADVPHGRGCVAVLERFPYAPGCPGHAPWDQCGSRRTSARRSLSPRVDQRDHAIGRSRARAHHIRPARPLECSRMARRRDRRPGRCTSRGAVKRE